MNDFLQSIRNQSKDKRYQQNNRPRRSYDNNNGGHGSGHHHSQQQHHNQQQNHSGNYHRGGDNNRNKYHQRPRQDHGHRDETLALVKELLEAMNAHQAQALEIQERRTIAEERKAEAIEEIAGIISALAGGDIPAMEAACETLDEVESAFSSALHMDDDEDDFFADPPEAPSLSKEEVLELIHKMRAEGTTYSDVADHLTGMGIPTFSGRGKWHAQTIHRLCQE